MGRADSTVLGLVALFWLIGAVLLMARSIRRGRRLVEVLAARHPDAYEAWGRPWPGYFETEARMVATVVVSGVLLAVVVLALRRGG